MSQLPILTVTLNPALDISARAEEVVSGPKLRVFDTLTEPGGGGVNVARAVRILGGQAVALAALGGATGVQMKALLAAEGTEVVILPQEGETRQSLTVTDAAGAQFRFVMPGPMVVDQVALVRSIVDAVPEGSLVVLSGSQPPGVTADFPLLLAGALPNGAKLVIDTSGDALQHVSGAEGTKVHTLRMNKLEVEQAAGRALPSLPEFADFCRSLVQRGTAEVVIAAWGREGNVLSNGREAWHCVPPVNVPVISRVGAGDSFVAGYTLALARGATLPEALSFGTATGSAAVMTPGTQLCRPDDVAWILSENRIVDL